MSNSEELYLSDPGDFLANFCKEKHDSLDDSLFYFETDYLPLKDNTDYLKLMRTLVILEAQRVKVCQDIQELEALRIKSIEDPLNVKKTIFEGKLSCLSRIKIEKVPDIDFSKYRSLSRDLKKSLPSRRKAARQQQKDTSKDQNKNDETPGSSGIKVRGRVYDENKPQTFNQLWTVEEQLRLEQLLIEIPPQPVEYRRWEKIAEALGSRTAKQVCSRVQKYFKKLSKAGLGPVGPCKKGWNKKRALKVHKQYKHYLYKPSTFFPGAAMGELEDTDSEDDCKDDVNTDLAHWEEIHKKIAEEKENNELRVEHFDYACQKCGVNPITGLRWECVSCPEVSFCSNCMSNLCDMIPPPHPVTHHFRYVDVFNNKSYNIEAFNCDNYLDPNAHID